MDYNERFFILFNHLKDAGRIKNYVQLADILGTNKAGINDIKSGKKKVTLDNIKSMILSYPDVNAEWILMEDGPILKENSISMSNAEVKEFNYISDDNKTIDRIPLYNIEAIAGIVPIFDDLHKQQPIDYITIPNLPKCDGAVHVVGDSMYPLLKSGDIILYKTLNDKANLFWGEMYLLSICNDGDTHITVKYVQRSDTDGYVKLVSQNQNHQDKEVPFDSIKFAALIKASVRINSMG